jgi:hypothetical protein
MTRQARTFSQVGEGTYQLTVLSLGIQLTVDRLRRERHELISELAVACDLPGAHVVVDGYLSVADFNLSSAHARATRAKLLAERSEAPDVDWFSLLEELCIRTLAAERQGTPAKLLHTFDRGETGALLDVDGWPWLKDHAMMTFADGGGLKSYLALYGAGVLGRRGVPVGYVDWELSGHDHRDRLERLFGPDMPLVHYFRCDRPLIEEADRLTRDAHKLGLEYLVFDSAGFGTAGPPEAAEQALQYFRAIRQIGLGSHHLAHVNRSDTGDQKPFGSSFWHNSARATWFAKLAGTSTDESVLTVGLYNRKCNLTQLHPAVGFKFEFDRDRTIVSRVNLADVEDLAGQLPTWQRIAHFLKAGGGQPRTITEIAEELDVKPDTNKKAISNRGKGRSLFVTVPGQRWQRADRLGRTENRMKGQLSRDRWGHDPWLG